MPQSQRKAILVENPITFSLLWLQNTAIVRETATGGVLGVPESRTKDWILPQFCGDSEREDQSLGRLSPLLITALQERTKGWKINPTTSFQCTLVPFTKMIFDVLSLLVTFAHELRDCVYCVCATFVLTRLFPQGEGGKMPT